MRYKKSKIFNILSLILSLLFLWQNIVYAYPASRDLLRIPVGENTTFNRMEDVLNPVLPVPVSEVLREDGWRPLALSVSVIREILNSENNFDDRNYSGWFEDGVFRSDAEMLFEGRNIIPTRINTYIANQSSYIEQALVELIANAQDATIGQKRIGRFGVGAYQMFQEIKTPEDSIVVVTSTDGLTASRFTFRLIDGQVCYKPEVIAVGVSKGTEIQVNTRFSAAEVRERIEYAGRKFRANSRGKININGRQVNDVSRYRYINGDSLAMPDGEPVEIQIDVNGYRIIDSGSGMSPHILFEKFLVPKGTTKALEGAPMERDAEIQHETKIFYLEPSQEEVKGAISIQISGVINIDIPIQGVNIPKEMIIELPHDAWLPESRDKISLDDITREGLIAVLNKITDLSRSDIKDRYCLLNAFALLIKALKDENGSRQLFVEARRLCDNLIHAERKAGKIILPNRKEFKALASKQQGEVIFLDESLYDFMPSCLSNTKYIDNFSSRAHTLYVTDLDTDNENDVYIEGKYPNGRGWIILDRRIYEMHKDNPWVINLLFNFDIGYGDKGKQLGSIIAERIDSKDELSAAASDGVSLGRAAEGEKATSDAELAVIIDSIFSSEAIQAYLKIFDKRDAELIRRKTEEAVRTGFINLENMVEMREKLGDWLGLLIELKDLLPESVLTGKWIRDEFFATYFQVFGEKGNIQPEKIQLINDKVYFCCDIGSKDKWFEMDKTGKILSLGESKKVVVLDGQVYVIEKDSSDKFFSLFTRKNGENEIIVENALRINVPSGKQDKEIIVFTDEGLHVGVKVVKEGKMSDFCITGKDLVEELITQKFPAYDLIKRGGYIFAVDTFAVFNTFFAKDLYRIDSTGNVSKFTPGKPYDFDQNVIDKCGVTDIKVLPDGSFAVIGESNDHDLLDRLKMTGARSTRYGMLLFDKDAHFKYSALETSNKQLSVWDNEGGIFFQDSKVLKRIDQNGELEEIMGFDHGEKVIDMQQTSEAYFVLLNSRVLQQMSIKDKNCTFHEDAFPPLVRMNDDCFYVPQLQDGTSSISICTKCGSSWSSHEHDAYYCPYCGIKILKDGVIKKPPVATIRKIDKKGDIKDLVVDETENSFIVNLYSNGSALFIVLKSRQNNEQPREMKLIKMDGDGKKQVLFSLSGYALSFAEPGISHSDSYIFSRAYDRMTYETDYIPADESGEKLLLFGEYFIFNIKTGEVNKVAVPNKMFSLERLKEKDDTEKYYISGGNVFHFDSKGLMALPSIDLMLNRTGILKKNLEQMRQSPDKIKDIVTMLNAEERAKMLVSMAAYENWIPAFIFLKDDVVCGYDIMPLKETFDMLLRSNDIKEIRQRFAFINFVFSKVKDEGLAAQIIQRWSRIVVKNQELAEVIAIGLRKEFDYKTPLEFTRDSDDITKLPLDIQLYLKFLLSDEFKIPQILQQEDFKGELSKKRIVNRDLAVLLRLREKFPEIARADVDWEAVIRCANELYDYQLEGIRRDIAGAVNGQDKTHFYWIRELMQNARDAIRDKMGIKTKSGFLGHGFYTVFAGNCGQIKIRTGNGKETNELILKPEYDPKGDIVRIEVLQMNNYKSDFKGTSIQRVNFYSSQTDDNAIMDMLYAFTQARRFLGSVPSKGENGVTILFNDEVINEDGYRSEDNNRIIKINSGMLPEPNRQGFYECVMSVEDPVGMDLYTILNKLLPPDISGKPEQPPKNIPEIGAGLRSSFSPEKIQRVNVDNLYVDAIDHKYTASIPQSALDVLLSRGWNIEFPQGTPVPRTRNSVIGVEKYAPWIAVSAFKTLIQLYLADKTIEINGLPQDYIYSKDNAIRVASDIEQDADLINEGSPGQVDFNKYMHDPHALVQLLTLINIEFEGKSVSLSSIKKQVLDEYKKDPSFVNLKGVLPSGIEHLRDRAEDYIRKAKGKKVDISAIKNEPFIFAIEKFSKVLNGLLGVEENAIGFVCEFNANYKAIGGRGGVIWNLAYYKGNLLPVLNFLVKGSADNEFVKFIETYTHETGHSVEDLFRKQYHNTWTHQAEQELEGSLGWIMKRLLTKMAGKIKSTDMLRQEVLRQAGFSIEELQFSYDRITELINSVSSATSKQPVQKMSINKDIFESI